MLPEIAFSYKAVQIRSQLGSVWPYELFTYP